MESEDLAREELNIAVKEAVLANGFFLVTKEMPLCAERGGRDYYKHAWVPQTECSLTTRPGQQYICLGYRDRHYFTHAPGLRSEQIFDDAEEAVENAVEWLEKR